MHQNYYFLRKLAPALNQRLSGLPFLESFSQEKDELVLLFGPEEVPAFVIKATLRSDFSCLSFPDSFQRARKNSVSLFTSLNGDVVTSVRIAANERAIRVDFSSGQVLVFKLYGNRSNIISFDQNHEVTAVFNHRLADHQVTLAAFDRALDQTFEAFRYQDGAYKKLFPTFGKLVNGALDNALEASMPLERRWQIIQDMLRNLDSGDFYLTEIDHLPVLALFDTGHPAAIYHDPMEALNAFYLAYIRLTGLAKEKSELLRILRKRLTQTDNYLENTFSKLAELEDGVKNDEIANILMANLHQIPPRAEVAELFDFYREQPIRIRLKKDLSAQKNAEAFYRKAKNEKIERSKLEESLEVREAERKRLQEHLEVVEETDSLRTLRTYSKTQGLQNLMAPKPTEELFKIVSFQGYQIWIGRNAKNNDLLTKHHAFKEDLWLHARDVPGSHVIVKYQAGKKFPAIVIERAAELAAFYSKRRTDSLCPVIVTPKKYVRKPKGLPEGAVVIDKEDVIMVVPRGDQSV